MRYVDLTPTEVARMVFKNCLNNLKKVEKVNFDLKKITLKELPNKKIERIDLLRVERLIKENDDLLFAMEEIGGKWVVELVS
jgi:hypothetical protein